MSSHHAGDEATRYSTMHRFNHHNLLDRKIPGDSVPHNLLIDGSKDAGLSVVGACESEEQFGA